MSQQAFALLSLFGVPVAIIGLLLLAQRLTPPAIWKTFLVQTLATLAFVGCIAVPFAILRIDSQGKYFDDDAALVIPAFGLPQGVTIKRQGDKSLRLGDCWRNSVNWRSEVTFPNADAFYQWYYGKGFRQGIVDQVAGYFGHPSSQVRVAPGALDLQAREAQYALSNQPGSYERNVRILPFDRPFVCTAIERGKDGSISLRRCDPIAEGGDAGNAGQVILRPDVQKQTLEGRIYLASGPSYCTNPLRRAVNTALGLPHPAGAEPNNLPVM
jgi:hypothetical protein